MDEKYEVIIAKVKALISGGSSQELAQLLQTLHPADIAEILEDLDDDKRRAFFATLPSDVAAAIVQELDLDDQTDIMHGLDAARISEIVKEMDSDDAADFIGELSESNAEKLLGLMNSQGDELRELLRYDEDTSGGIMATEYVTVRDSWTVEQAFCELRRVGPDAASVYYVYVLDDREHLVGVLSLRDMVISDLVTKISVIMNPSPVSVPVEADQEEAAELFKKYRFLALPVVDYENRITGVITADDILDVVEEEATEDMQKIAGTVPLDHPYFASRLRELWGSRIAWLVVLFLAESITGGIMQKFSDAMQAFIQLTFFIPLLIDCGGNAGSQSATVIIRGLAVRDVRLKDAWAVLCRELVVGLGLGVVMAAIAFVRAWRVGGNPMMGLVVCLSVAAIVVMATVVGALLPIAATALKMDPAVMSAPLITTIVDGLGLLVYFSIAKALLPI
ncbi:MAG: magnesium transporter [Clostridia bacterium]|nr:magnesium transporter [Clostridia bacterium]